MSSREEAHKLVNGIFETHGFLTEEQLQRFSESDRPMVEGALRYKDNLLNDSIKAYGFTIT